MKLTKCSLRKLVLLSWLLTYQCVNLLQDLHKLLSCGFYFPIKSAESFSLQILSQKTLWRNNTLLQGFIEDDGKLQATALIKQPQPQSTFPQEAGPDLRTIISSSGKKQKSWPGPSQALWQAAGHSLSCGLLELQMPPEAWLWWSPRPQCLPTHKRQALRAQGLESDRPGLVFQLPWTDLCSWATDWTYLRPSVLIFKMALMIPTPQRATVRTKGNLCGPSI